MNIDVQVLLSEGQLSPRDLEKGDAKELVSPVLDRLEEDHIVTVESLGKNCHLPGSFQVWPLTIFTLTIIYYCAGRSTCLPDLARLG